MSSEIEKTVFISYAREDSELACCTGDLLVASGLKPWLDVDQLVPGRDWRQSVEAALSDASVMLVLRERAETYHVTAASGTSTATRKRTVLPRRPSPSRRRSDPWSACPASCTSVRRLMEISCGLKPERPRSNR